MTPQRILIVTDNLAITARVQTALERKGFSTETIANGTAALKRVHAKSPVLALLNLILPDVDGWLVCRPICRPACIPTSRFIARERRYI